MVFVELGIEALLCACVDSAKGRQVASLTVGQTYARQSASDTQHQGSETPCRCIVRQLSSPTPNLTCTRLGVHSSRPNREPKASVFFMRQSKARCKALFSFYPVFILFSCSFECWHAFVFILHVYFNFDVFISGCCSSSIFSQSPTTEHPCSQWPFVSTIAVLTVAAFSMNRTPTIFSGLLYGMEYGAKGKCLFWSSRSDQTVTSWSPAGPPYNAWTGDFYFFIDLLLHSYPS